MGIDPYPALLYPVNITSAYIRENYKGESNAADFKDVSIAGRIMGIRDMGKASFAVSRIPMMRPAMDTSLKSAALDSPL